VGFLRFASVAALVSFASFSVACSSTVGGESDQPIPKTWDIAVGATVTLHVTGIGRCNDPGPSEYVCLDARSVARISKAEIVGGSGLTVVRTRSERLREDEMLVDVRADKGGGGTLKITFEDRIDGAKTNEFPVRALDVTHVDEKIGCQFQFDAGAHRYPISRGSTVRLDLEAKHNDIGLLSGAMPLVADDGGLPPTDTLDAEGVLVTRNVVPQATGTFTWKLAGARSNTVVLDVYDPETVGISVSSPKESEVTVRASVNGEPTCFYGGTHRAMTKISAGACKLVVGDFEVEGDLPVSLARGGETFLVEGSGQCTVEARIASGPAGSTTVTGKTSALAAVPNGGDVLGTTPIEKGGTLKNRATCLRATKISNGKCEAIDAGGYVVAPDGDCIIDFDWFADPYEGDAPNTHPVGVGLLTELRIGLKLKLFGLVTLKPLVPNALRWDATPLEVQSLGCDNAISNYEALAIRPSAEGHQNLHFNADNADEALDYDVQAKTIGGIRFLDGEIDIQNGTSYHFLRSEVDVKVSYTDSAGRPLRGIGPVRISSTDPAANAKYTSEIFTGTSPNRITLASPAAPMTHVIEAVDASAVGSVGGIAPKVRGRDVVCVEPFAQTAAGQRIHGTSPTRPRLSVTGGDACGIVGGFAAGVAVSTGRGELCAATVAGRPDAAIVIHWGGATTTWPCRAER
jgi:hypothetical protein